MKEAKVLEHDPLSDAEEILRENFYGQPSARPDKSKPIKPAHYKVVCISLYTRDIELLEEKVAELKRRGYTKANKSQLIRFALSQVDIDKLPPTP